MSRPGVWWPGRRTSGLVMWRVASGRSFGSPAGGTATAAAPAALPAARRTGSADRGLSVPQNPRPPRPGRWPKRRYEGSHNECHHRGHPGAGTAQIGTNVALHGRPEGARYRLLPLVSPGVGPTRRDRRRGPAAPASALPPGAPQHLGRHHASPSTSNCREAFMVEPQPRTLALPASGPNSDSPPVSRDGEYDGGQRSAMQIWASATGPWYPWRGVQRVFLVSLRRRRDRRRAPIAMPPIKGVRRCLSTSSRSGTQARGSRE